MASTTADRALASRTRDRRDDRGRRRGPRSPAYVAPAVATAIGALLGRRRHLGDRRHADAAHEPVRTRATTAHGPRHRTGVRAARAPMGGCAP